MRLTGKRLKNGTKLERVTLYHFEKSAEFEVCENDASTGIVDHVNCCICMDEYEEAVFGNEYRSQYLEKRGQQRADLMCFLLSEMNRRLASYVYEIKHSVSGPDRVYDICGQLTGSFREIKGMIAGLGCEDQMSHVSSGGGACINMLAGKPLAAVEALKKSND